jgi:hypothetical protein
MAGGDSLNNAQTQVRPFARLLVAGSVGAIFAATAVTCPDVAKADEGGVSFWLPGLFGSFAAAPGAPGWSVSFIYIHPSVGTTAGKTFQDGTNFVTGIKGRADLLVYGATYTFAQPVLGGQAAFSLFNPVGGDTASVSGTLTGPLGHEISGARSESVAEFGDLIPQATLKWNKGVNDFMVYATGDIPVGAYDPSSLVNVGLGHGAFDWGGGYTYLNPATGLELSGVLGLTYNFENPSTQYQNGLDAHFDWGLSHFLTKEIDVGVAGYFYQQITDDSGPGAKLGGFRSRVAGIGPQVNFFFPVTDKIQGYANVKVYDEFAAENRPSGWNLWLTLSFSEAPPHPSAAEQAALTK